MHPFLNWRFLTGLGFLIVFFTTLLIVGASTVEPGPRTAELDGGSTITVRIGKTWPGSFDSCITDQDVEGAPNCYREPIAKQSIIKQPAGAASALVFSAIGLVILFIAGVTGEPKSEGPVLFDRTYKTVYGFVVLFMGPGAIIFHSTLTAVGGWFDQISMYLLLGFMSGFGFTTRFGRSKLFFFLYFLGFIIVYGIGSALLIAFTEGAATWVFMGTAILVGVLELLALIEGTPFSFKNENLTRDWWHYVSAISLLALAIAAWIPSMPANGAPTDFPWHSVWHMASALFVAAFYMYLDSQRHEPPVSDSLAPQYRPSVTV